MAGRGILTSDLGQLYGASSMVAVPFPVFPCLSLSAVLGCTWIGKVGH